MPSVYLFGPTYFKNVFHSTRSISNFVFNAGHNTLKFRNVSGQIWFTTSKTEIDIQYHKFCVRIAEAATRDAL